VLGIAAVAIAAGCNDHSTATPTRSRINLRACPVSIVHYQPRPGTERSLRLLPWVAAQPNSSQIIGHLFYYAAHGVDWRARKTPGFRIFVHGRVPDSGGAGTKILWIDYSHRASGEMRVTGHRLDRPGMFQQTFPTLGPSTIAVPTTGCWRLALQAGAARGMVTVRAVQ
jgi:hypothetical protein